MCGNLFEIGTSDFNYKEVSECEDWNIVYLSEGLTILQLMEKPGENSWSSLIEDKNINNISYITTYGHTEAINSYLDFCESNQIKTAKTIKIQNCVNTGDEIKSTIERIRRLNYRLDWEEDTAVLKLCKIPRIIHQTWKQKENLPKVLADNIETIKLTNHRFEHRLYDDKDCENYIMENYGNEMLNTYLSINPEYPQARADLFRYLLMYREGGVYLDIKSGTRIPMDEVILPEDEYILTHWDMYICPWSTTLNYQRGEFQNWQITCAPGHPYLRATIERVLKNIEEYDGKVGKKAVLMTTGPIPYSLSILDLGIPQDGTVRVFTDEDIGLVYQNTPIHHHKIYKGYSNKRIVNKKRAKT
jgi:hypothetical protein